MYIPYTKHLVNLNNFFPRYFPIRRISEQKDLQEKLISDSQTEHFFKAINNVN